MSSLPSILKLPWPQGTFPLTRPGQVYLVGGSVRDLLLGRRPIDLDLAVAENPRAFALRLAAHTGGRLVPLGKPGLMLYRIVRGPQVMDVSAVAGQPGDVWRVSAKASDAPGLVARAEAEDALMEAVRKAAPDKMIPVLGITGTGGAGKSSLTDELLNRLLRSFPDRRIAVLAVDPTRRRTGGALLGDRIRMNSLRNEHFYMRSMATRRQHLATSAILQDAIAFLRSAGFDLVIVETAGIGQSDSEIVDMVDFPMYVMTSDFGAQSQLEKIDMLDFADLIVAGFQIDKPVPTGFRGGIDVTALGPVYKHGGVHSDIDELVRHQGDCRFIAPDGGVSAATATPASSSQPETSTATIALQRFFMYTFSCRCARPASGRRPVFPDVTASLIPQFV